MQETFVKIPNNMYGYKLIRVETSFGGGASTAATYLKLEQMDYQGQISQVGATWVHAANNFMSMQNFYNQSSILNLHGKDLRLVLDNADQAVGAKGFTATLTFAKTGSQCDPDEWELM